MGLFEDELSTTLRGIEDYLPMVHDSETYPLAWMHPKHLQGLKLLDVCCGLGGFVRQLTDGVDFEHKDGFFERFSVPYRDFWHNLAPHAKSESMRTGLFKALKEGGIDITGIDKQLSDEQRKDARFKRGDIRSLWFIPDRSIDGIYSAWGPFSFTPLTHQDVRDGVASLKEFGRVLKPKTGFIRLGKVMEWGYLREMLRQVPQLTLKQLMRTPPESLTPDELVAAELVKTR